MGKAFNASVILPATYNKSAKRYPVIYLLHGYSQNYAGWSKIVPLDKYSDTFQVIFVCPDGNRNSWYIDSPIKTNSKFETYISKEVVAFIDSAYRTIASVRGRAIAGSSMGGHGALRILWNNQDRFVAATSISGILDLTPFAGQWDIAQVIGTFAGNKRLWQQYSVAWLARKIDLRQRDIFIDCGIQDPALACNRQVHEILIERNIVHDYRESAGGHTPQYVRNAFEYHLIFLMRQLKKAGK